MADMIEGKREGRRRAARVRLIARRFKNHWLSLAIGLLAGGLIFSGAALKAITEISDFFFPKHDALSLAREGVRDQVSRDFVETVSRRLYLSRNFIARVERKAPSVEIHDSWLRLTNAIETMNSKTLVYTSSFEQFYGTRRRFEFENGIQTDFNEITSLLVNFRYSAAIKKMEFPSSSENSLLSEEVQQINSETERLSTKLDHLNVRIYHFVNCFEKKQQTKDSCKDM